MRLRSLLFVPGDRPDRFLKAATSGADVLILDFEDSVSPGRKDLARDAVREWLFEERKIPCLVRLNPLGTPDLEADIAAIQDTSADGLVLPKSVGGKSVETLIEKIGEACPPILPICAETASSVFSIGEHVQSSSRLLGLTWGAEDLSTSIATSSSRYSDGAYIAPLEVARALVLFAAHAAGVPAIETVYPSWSDTAGLSASIQRARTHGFTGMLAIHPAQIELINRGFSPGEGEIAAAREVIAAFEAHPDAGALQVGRRMVDRPHLARARAVLTQAGAL